jgi:pyridoxal phosphate enzyme (YggS family)
MDIDERFAAISARIKTACEAANREPQSVTLVAVSKVQSDARIAAALALGHRVFGENRVQEAQAHWAAHRPQHKDLRLHLIGQLQTNKAADAIALFDVIETLDRPKLAATFAQLAKSGARLPELLVQVNTGEERQKSGVLPQDLDGFLRLCSEEHGLKIAGLMCIPPVDDPPALHFALLAKLAKRHNLTRLSMGMSDDFEAAIPFGATHVRIGSALFGVRGTEDL